MAKFTTYKRSNTSDKVLYVRRNAYKTKIHIIAAKHPQILHPLELNNYNSLPARDKRSTQECTKFYQISNLRLFLCTPSKNRDHTSVS